MIQITYGQAKAQIARIAGSTGMSVSDPRVLERTNLAIQELMDEGDFPNVVDRYHMRFDQATGLISLPYFLDRMISATVDHVPTTIVSPWWEFVAYGAGYQDDYYPNGGRRYNWIDVVTDRGESPVRTPIPDAAVSELTGPWVLRVYATVNETECGVIPVLNVQGLDSDGLAIRTSDGTADVCTNGTSDGTATTGYYNGVKIPIDFSVAYTETTQEFSKITAVVKPETRSYVRLTAWNGTDEVELANYAYDETAPSYRHYYIPHLHNRGRSGAQERVLLARCRKRFVPITADNDMLVISNLPALKAMVVAVWQRETGEFQAYAAQKQTAIDILRKEAMGYLGKARVPAVSFSRGFPMGSVPFVR